MVKRLACCTLLLVVAVLALYSFYHRGIKVPLKAAISIKETDKRGGDFWSTFPASFTEKYNPALCGKTIARGWYKGDDWGYGPIQHLITLPLTLLTSIRLTSIIWLMANYIFLALTVIILFKILTGLSFAPKAIILFLWLGFWPLHGAIEENVIEIFELFLIILSLYLLYNRRDALSGVSLGLASMAKFLPLIFLVYFLIKGRFKAFFAMAATVIIIIIGTQATLGWQNSEMFRRFFSEIKEGKYDYTYWRSQTIPSTVERIFSATGYSSGDMYYPKVKSPKYVKLAVMTIVPLAAFAAFALISMKRKKGDPGIEYGIVSLLMFLISLHGEFYYLIFSLIGYSFAVRYICQKRERFLAALLVISYFLSGYIMQMKEFDLILLPRYTDINREVFFSFLSFPTYGSILLFMTLLIILSRE